MNKNSLGAAILMLFSLNVPPCAEAINKIEPDSVNLKEVVVSANRHLTLRKEAPTLVSIIDSKLFDNIQGSCLADGLDYEPGVRVGIGCRNCGKIEASINGLDGNYSQILIDSRPLFSSANSIYALEQIPANMIDRVEVIRGGSSALFGSSAVGGVINIITRQPSNNGIELSHTFSVLGKGSFDNVTSLNGSIISSKGKSGINFYAQNRERSPYDRNGDGYSELTKLRTQIIGSRMFFNINDFNKVNAHIYRIGDYRRGGNNLDLPAHESNIAEQTEHNIMGGSADYDWHSKDLMNHFTTTFAMQSTHRKSYFGGIMGGSDKEKEEALTSYGKLTEQMIQLESQYCRHFDKFIFMPSTLTLGLAYDHSQLKDKSLWYNTSFSQTVNSGSAYVQNEWKNDDFTLLISARADKNNLLKKILVSPRANVRYRVNNNWTLRVSYGEGFRNPQYFDDDLHEKLIGGNRITTQITKNLKEERSRSLSLSTDYNTYLWNSMPLDLLVEGFYTHLSNTFIDTYTSAENGNKILLRTNGPGASVYGTNIELNLKPVSWIPIQGGFTWQQAFYQEAKAWSDNVEAQKRMMRTPHTYSYFTLKLNPWEQWQFVVSGKHTGSMLVGHSAGSGTDNDITVSTPTFIELGCKASYTFNVVNGVSMELFSGIHNLLNQFQKDLDTGYQRDSEFTYGPLQPITFYIGAKIKI